MWMRIKSINLTNLIFVKFKIIFFSLFILSLFLHRETFGQEGLLIRNIKNGNAWMYEIGARVTYIQFHEDEYTTGVLRGLLDSAVVFGKDTVRLKNIAGIRKKSPLHNLTRVIGLPLMLIGSIFMGEGVAGMYSNPDSDDGAKLLLLGAGVFAVGYIPFELNRKDLTVGLGGEWTIEVCKGAPL